MAAQQVEIRVRCKSCGEKIRTQAPQAAREVRAQCPACRSWHSYPEYEFEPREA